jgi:hypothetical protein
VIKSSYQISSLHLRFVVLMTVTVKITVPWDRPLCSLLDIHRRFGGTRRLNLSCRWRRTLRNVGKHQHYSTLHPRGRYAYSLIMLIPYSISSVVVRGVAVTNRKLLMRRTLNA